MEYKYKKYKKKYYDLLSQIGGDESVLCREVNGVIDCEKVKDGDDEKKLYDCSKVKAVGTGYLRYVIKRDEIGKEFKKIMGEGEKVKEGEMLNVCKEPFKILIWNTLDPNSRDGELGYGSHGWNVTDEAKIEGDDLFYETMQDKIEARKGKIKEFISDFAPSLVLSQEYFDGILNTDKYINTDVSLRRGNQLMKIFLKNDLGEITEVKRDQENILECTIKINSKNIKVLNVHLSKGLTDSLIKIFKNETLESNIKYINKLIAQFNENTTQDILIIGGDFNTGRSGILNYLNYLYTTYKLDYLNGDYYCFLNGKSFDKYLEYYYDTPKNTIMSQHLKARKQELSKYEVYIPYIHQGNDSNTDSDYCFIFYKKNISANVYNKDINKECNQLIDDINEKNKIGDDPTIYFYNPKSINYPKCIELIDVKRGFLSDHNPVAISINGL